MKGYSKNSHTIPVNKTTMKILELIAREQTQESTAVFFDKFSFWSPSEELKSKSEYQQMRDAQIHMARSILQLEGISFN